MTAWKVPLSETTLGEEEASAAAEVVRSGWLTQGARVGAFESAFAETLGLKNAVAVANCTVGLELSYAAMGIGAGDEVIVPALTFVATANAARRLGATPVFADVCSADDLTVDPRDVARKITPRTRAICAVHYAGYPADVPSLKALGLPVIEDCAHAPGARLRDVPCGMLGDVAAFSFFSNKNMTTGEGGMVTSPSDAIAARVRLARSHGMTTTTWDRHRGHAFTYDVEVAGTNARMDEIRAAIGIAQLRKLAAGNTRRRAAVERYRERLRADGRVQVPFVARDAAESAHHLMVVILPANADRERVMTMLRESGIQSSIHYPPTHRFHAYRSDVALPVTDSIAPRLLTLPLFSTITDEQIDLVCDELSRALG